MATTTSNGTFPTPCSMPMRASAPDSGHHARESESLTRRITTFRFKPMRTPRRVDAKHAAIAEGLRRAGFSVTSIAAVGKGAPDLLVGKATSTGRLNGLLEVKDGSKPPARRRLTPDEDAWHASWRGQVAVVTSLALAPQACSTAGLRVEDCT